MNLFGKLVEPFRRSDPPPVPCERCGADRRAGIGCIPRPDAIRYGHEPPGEPDQPTHRHTSCPGCRTPLGAFHHSPCAWSTGHQPTTTP
jgi:hypothetical protein